MLLIPTGFTKEVHPGAKHYHGQRSECERYFTGRVKGKPGRPSKRVCTGEASRVPVGAIIREEPCPPILASIDELWASRCAYAPANPLCTTDCARSRARRCNRF